MRRLIHGLIAFAVFAAVLATSAVAAPTIGATESNHTPKAGPDFGHCSELFGPEPSPENPPVDCARISVPIDYANPHAGTVSLAITRFPAANGSENALGNLFVNPGGPGGPAIDMVEGLGFTGQFSEWNLIGVDPRGVGRSGELACDPLVDETPFPVGKSFEAEIVRGQTFYEECTADSMDAALFAQLNTANVARDFDMVRAALGEEKLNYFGASYGTHIGAVYAVLFPDRVGRFILDGPILVDDRTEGWLEQVRGFQNGLERFDAACAAEPSCPLHRFGVKRVYKHLEWRLAKEPMTATVDGPDGPVEVTVDVKTLRDGFIPALYIGRDIWADMAAALLQAAWGDASQIAFFASVFDNPSIASSNYLAVTCNDDPTRVSLHDARRAVRDEILAGNDVFAFAIGLETVTCNHIPASDGPLPPLWLDQDATPPMLVVAVTHDPATSYAGALRYVDQIGPARLLTVTDDGHGAVGFGNHCVDHIAHHYLHTGDVPPEGTVCGPPGRIGLRLADTPEGIVVDGVQPGGPADGVVEVGDLVVSFNGGPPRPPEVGEIVMLTVIRDGERLELDPMTATAPYWLPD